MFKNFYLSIGIFLLIEANQTNGQNWIKQYPISGISFTSGPVESYDKGFYIAGTNGYFAGANNLTGCNIILYKADVNGNILWRRIIGKSKQFAAVGGISTTVDGGLIVSGAIASNPADTANNNFLLKLDACGNVVWSKIYKLNRNSVSGPVRVLNNGDFVVFSRVSVSYDTTHNFYNTCLFLTDPMGNLKWQHFDHLSGFTMFIDKMQNIITTGESYLPYPGNNAYIFVHAAINKFDTLGHVSWSGLYGLENHILCQGVATVQTKDNGYLTFGIKRNLSQTIGSAIYLIKYNSNGLPQWAHLIGDSIADDEACDITKLNDSVFVLIALSGQDINNNGGDVKLFKINDNGQVLKQQILPVHALYYNNFWVNKTSDENFIMGGVVTDSNNVNIILTVKFNSNLDLDTFYTNDTNKYDYLCNQKIEQSAVINLSTDTVYITIPFPNTDTLPIPGSFLVYPNPTTSSIVHIRCPAGNSNATLTMYDVLGRLINTYSFVPGDTGHTNFDLGNVASGCYIMALWQDGKRYVQKVIVQ